MSRLIIAAGIASCAWISTLACAELTVGNVRAAQRAETKLVDIDYDLFSTEPFARITMEISSNGGLTYAVPTSLLTGAIGGAVRPGTNQRITWNAGADWNGQLSQQMRFRVSAETAPPGFAVIPAGSFQMGDNYAEGAINERPVHRVYTSRILMARYETTTEQMREVLQWAYDHELISVDATTVTNREGAPRPFLSFVANDHGKQATYLRFANDLFYIEADKASFPMGGITWYGALAYCNYLSDIEGLPRCIDFNNWTCDFSKAGFRLPTEAEWEKAGRGGLTGNHYSWPSMGGTYVQHIAAYMAKYYDTRDPWYPTTNWWSTPVGYFNGRQLNNGVRIGNDMANGFSLYDMAGNVWEWCWDNWQADWYSQPGSTQDDTTGPVATGPVTKVIRGGGYGYYGISLRVANRHSQGWSPGYLNFPLGFRPVRVGE